LGIHTGPFTERWNKHNGATLLTALQKLRNFAMRDPFEDIQIITALLHQAEPI